VILVFACPAILAASMLDPPTSLMST
jgi:hypothetical protein